MVPEGQEQDDDDVEEEEIGKQPIELEDMLELFREPEEPLRKGFNPMWLVFGLVAVVAFCWLASLGVQAFVGEMSALQGGAPKSAKFTVRAPEPVVDLQTDYRERCRKGMTKDELRWILADFRKARLDKRPGGLTREIQNIFDAAGGREVWGERDDDDPLPIGPAQIAELKAKALQLAKAQQDWYVDALADGLRLDAEQIAKAKEKGRQFIAEKEGDFLTYEDEWRSAIFGPGGSGGVIGTGIIRGRLEGVNYTFPESGLLVAYYWLKEAANAPWIRCALTPEQLALTNFAHVKAQHGENATAGWMIAPETKNAKGEELRFPKLLEVPACILPFTAEQAFPRDEDGDPLNEAELSVVTKLHPAQFKLLLLADPDLADEVQGLLNYE